MLERNVALLSLGYRRRFKRDSSKKRKQQRDVAGRGGAGHPRELSQMMERECSAMLGEFGANGGNDGDDDDERLAGLVLVPFWGGTAEASGGNSHSEATVEAKHMQAAGTVCSAMK